MKICLKNDKVVLSFLILLALLNSPRMYLKLFRFITNIMNHECRKSEG